MQPIWAGSRCHRQKATDQHASYSDKNWHATVGNIAAKR
jgi:hypothetical protein